MKFLSLSWLFLSSSLALAGEIPKDEDYTRLLSIPVLNSMDQLLEKGVDSGATQLDLWSGSYWPMYQGSLAGRYRQAATRALYEDSEKYQDYQQAATLSAVTDDLSVAEKYDRLVGDAQQTFTRSQWDNALKNRGVGGRIPNWRGICDGWAAATMTWPRPQQSVTLQSPQGEAITFYPEDIKALGSQLHAKGEKKVTFLGRRCNGSTGYMTGACDETNPGALHLALANRVGVAGKSLVIDASPGKEVWNYPVQSYQFSYLHPLSGAESKDWKEVRMPLVGNEGKIIKGRSRAKGTVYVVAVKAQVKIMDMREANLETSDDPSFDKIDVRNWHYDLELDAQGRVLGGEWIKKNGPDFIWAPREDSHPVSLVEKQIGLKFDPAGAVSHSVGQAALTASQAGQPLAVIVETLFKLSQD